MDKYQLIVSQTHLVDKNVIMNIFSKIYDLSNSGEFALISGEMLDEAGEMRTQYRVDLNHAWYLVGDALLELEIYDEALVAFQKSYTEDDSDYMALMAQASCCSELGAYTAAELILKLAISLSDENSDHYYNLGNALFDQKKYQEAIDAYNQVFDSNRESFDLAQQNIAVAKMRLEK